MLTLLIIFTTTIVSHAKRNEESKNSSAWNHEVFTYEGVDFMLDAGRRNASIEQQQEYEEDLHQVQILVKPKSKTPAAPSPRQDSEEGMAFKEKEAKFLDSWRKIVKETIPILK